MSQDIIDQYVTADALRGNLINFSGIRKLERAFSPRSFGVKYVVEGTEKYVVNKRKYAIQSNEYLLVNAECACEIAINSQQQVKGICIELSPQLLADVSKTLQQPDVLDQMDLSSCMISAHFFQNRYAANQTTVGHFLKQTESYIGKQPHIINTFSLAFYWQLAERLLADQMQLVAKLNNIQSVKYSTREELLRRVLCGKQYMDDCFLQKLEIIDIAAVAQLSEYHFFRLFKSVFHISPYQYLVEKRLQYAAKELKENNKLLSDIALETGFSDLSNFSRAFKKRFGVTASVFSRI